MSHAANETAWRETSHAKPGLPKSELPPLLDRSLLLTFRGLVGHLQVVLHAENPGDAIGTHESHFLVGLCIDNAIQFHMAVLYGDADGLGGIDRVLVQGREAIDGARNGHPGLI